MWPGTLASQFPADGQMWIHVRGAASLVGAVVTQATGLVGHLPLS